MMTTFKHKDIEINLLDSGKFCFTLHGNEIECTSLAAAKKRIDGAVSAAFEPFEVIYFDGEIETVVGISNIKRSNWQGDRSEFSFKSRKANRPRAYKNTPENVKLFAEWKAYREETDRIAKERRRVAYKIESRLAVIKADDFNIDGTRKDKP